MVIAIDFDGTCVTDEYPNIGKEIGAIPVLQTLVNNGHKLVLHTMRSGSTLSEAQQWFAKNEIPLYGINENPTQKNWTHSPKAYANLYIDNAALGAPLLRNYNKPYIDWRLVVLDLQDRGCLFAEDASRLMKPIIDCQNNLSLFE